MLHHALSVILFTCFGMLHKHCTHLACLVLMYLNTLNFGILLTLSVVVFWIWLHDCMWNYEQLCFSWKIL